MPPPRPPDPRRAPLARLRYEAGAAKAYLAGPRARRRLMRRERLLWVLGRHVTPLVAVESGGIRYLVDATDRGPITLGLFAHGAWDAPLMARVVRCLGEQAGLGDALRGKVFVDVGANIGTATLCALHEFGASRALALEPHPQNFRMLRANLALNGLDDRAVTLRAAVSDAPVELELEMSTHNIGDHRIRTGSEADRGALDERERSTVRVPAVALDALVAEHAISPADIGLVWVDVQGHEPQVLAGATTLLRSGVPVLIEYWPYGLRRAGGLERLHGLVERWETDVWEIGEERDERRVERIAPRDVAALADRYPGEDDATNLLLVRR